jgi:exonuclease III
MHIAICQWIVWGFLWGVLKSVQYSGAVPVAFFSDYLYELNAGFLPTPILSYGAPQSYNGRQYYSSQPAIRRTRGGRWKQRSIGVTHSSSRSNRHTSQGGANNSNLSKIPLTENFLSEDYAKKNNSNLSFGLINARSVKNKAIHVCEYVLDNKLDILAITETWLGENDTVVKGNICPPGYKLFTESRVNQKGGGVAILYKSDLKVTKIANKSFASFEHLDVLIQCPESDGLLISLIYRPPPNKKNGFTAKQFRDELSDFLDHHILDKNRLLVCGDFNVHVDNDNCNESKEFKFLMESYGLLQHIKSSTHQKGHTLDLIFTRDADSLVSNVVVNDTQLSDHYWILCSLKVARPKSVPKTISYRKLKEIDVPAFRNDIANSSLGTPSDNESIDDLAANYSSVFSSLLDKHAPLMSKQVIERPHSPWYNSDIKDSKRKCRKAERKWRKTKLEIHRQIYVSALQDVANKIEAAKKQYYGSKIEKADQKTLYKLATNLLHKQKDRSLPLFDSAYDIASKFNNFFVQKVLNIRNDLQAMLVAIPSQPTNSASSLPHQPLNITNIMDCFTPSSPEEIKKIIISTKNAQCSLDPIPTKLLKECVDVLLPIITKIVNMSLAEGVMPCSLKKALVVPLLKKLNLLPELLKHYRPVSNLAYLSKIIERVVANRLRGHMDVNHLHELFQSAYKALHSCETALIRVHNDVMQAVDRGQCVMLILLDLSAAFDTVDHERLLQVLSQRIGLQGTALKWFKSYLSERIQSVIINGTESDIWNILFGVPQGSVLGPILFIIYTSPLGDILRHHGITFHCYADDTQMYLSFNIDSTKEAIDKMESCIRDVRHWMAVNFLKFNDAKTELLVIGTPAMLKKLPPIQLLVGDDTISPSQSARNIGALFDSSMSMSCHITQICKGAWYQLRQIAQIRQYLNSKAAATLMHSFVSSRLDNFNSLLYGIPKYQIGKLQRVLNAAARIVSKTGKYHHITPVLVQLHWLPISYRICYKILLLTYKALNGKAPTYISDLLHVSKKTRTLRSNNQLLLDVPKCRLATYGYRSFSYAAPLLWNALPEDCRRATSVELFKSLLKTNLFKQAFDV